MAVNSRSLRRSTVAAGSPTQLLPEDAYSGGQLEQGAYADLIGKALSSYEAAGMASTGAPGGLPPRPPDGYVTPDAEYVGEDQSGLADDFAIDPILFPTDPLDPALNADKYKADIANINAAEMELTESLRVLDESFAAQEASIFGQRTGQRNQLNLAGISGASGLRSRALSVEDEQFQLATEMRAAEHLRARRSDASALAGISRDRETAELNRRTREQATAEGIRSAELSNLKLQRDSKVEGIRLAMQYLETTGQLTREQAAAEASRLIGELEQGV